MPTAARVVATGLAWCALLACATGRPPIVRMPVAEDMARFLAPPSESCGPTPGNAVEPDDLHRLLLSDRAAALEVRRLGLAGGGRGAAWRLVAAQAAVVAGLLDSGRAESSQLAAEEPDCRGAWLLAGRLEELADRPAPALEAYLRARPLPAAAERVEALRPAVVGALAAEIDDAIASRRLDEAEAAYVTLESLAPPGPTLARAEAALAAARGDAVRELAALRRLRPNPQVEEQAAARWADLELERGDPGTGVRLFEEIVRRHPGDTAWNARLARAKFAWRQTLLPDAVQQVAARPLLTRGDLAVVLFWVAPGVRHARATASIIATDVVDHPFREEIVRTVNLGLLRIDEVLRSFAPYRPAQRGEALEAVLRARQLIPSQTPTAPCGDPSTGTISRETVCRQAVECGLLTELIACLPGAPVSGPEVTQWLATVFASQEAARDRQ